MEKGRIAIVGLERLKQHINPHPPNNGRVRHPNAEEHGNGLKGWDLLGSLLWLHL